MGAPIYPNLGGALVQGLQARSLIQQQDQQEKRRGLAPDVQSALGGDSGALGRIASVDPDYAIKLGPILDKLDADKQAVLKRAADFTVQAGMGVINSPPEARPQAYAAAMAEAQRLRIPTEKWPQQWGPQAEGWLQFNVNKAIPVAKWFEENQKTLRETPTPIVPGGGTAVAGRPGAPAPDQQQFIQTMMPHALAIAQQTGLDPRLVLAQSALETGFGASAPGNNYFGIKGGNGPPMATTEAGPGGALVPAQASFRSYPDVGASAKDYVDFVKGNQGRYAPVLQAQGLDAQIDAMGKSGYATDPQYAAKLRAIAQSLPAPPSAASPQVAQAGGPPVIPQGDASGNPPQIQTRDPTDPRGRGGIPLGVKGQPVLKDGHQLYLLPDGTQEWHKAPPPQQSQKAVPPSGYREGANGSLEFIPGGPADPEVIRRTSDTKRLTSEKAIPGSVVKGMQENLDALKQVDRALDALKANPGSVGGIGSTIASVVPGTGNLQNRWGDPEGTQLRALIADIGSLKIHDRSGAAVTAAEFPRLKPFVPTISDDPKTVETKLNNFKAVYEQTLRDTSDYYNGDNGFKAHGPTQQYLDGGAPAAAPTAPAVPKANGPADQGRAMFEARDAIKKGADRKAVEERLRQMGVDPKGL